MKLKLLLDCTLKDRLELNIERNCVLKKDLRPNLLVDDIRYVSFIINVYEKNYLQCEMIVLLSSDYSIENYNKIFKIGKNVAIIEGSKRLSECIIQEVEEVKV